jgi:hypothetical protein
LLVRAMQHSNMKLFQNNSNLLSADSMLLFITKSSTPLAIH